MFFGGYGIFKGLRLGLGNRRRNVVFSGKRNNTLAMIDRIYRLGCLS